jgi:predicted nucleic acid-binding protein
VIYADTNFLTSLFCPGPNEDEAARLDVMAATNGAGPYPVTLLCRLEFVNALQQSVFATRHGVPGFRMNAEHALVAEATFHERLAGGRLLFHAVVGEQLLERQFHELAHRHTAKEGFRTYDILHVSSALALGCDTFWSFDAKAKRLAKLEGLAVN